MNVCAVKTATVELGANLVEVILDSLKENGLRLENNDVLALASKIVSYAENRLVKLSEVKPSDSGRKLAQEFDLQPEFAELVLREAERICAGVERAVLTLKNGVLTANAGIDNKNAPVGCAILWPRDPKESAKRVREEIKRVVGLRIAVVIVDSGLAPLRRGTTGLALAVAGFKPVRDVRGKGDIYGKKIAITTHAVADDLASAAHLLMGEGAEKTPIVLIRDAPVDFDDNAYGSADMMMPPKECIFANTCRCT